MSHEMVCYELRRRGERLRRHVDVAEAQTVLGYIYIYIYSIERDVCLSKYLSIFL